MSHLFTLPRQAPLKAGASLAAARLYFFQQGSTTPQNVYTTAALAVAHDHPVEADANGIFPAIYLNPSAAYDYRVQLKTSADVLQYDEDNVPRLPATQAQIGAALYPRTTAEQSAGVTPSAYAYPPGDVRRYGAVGDGSTNDTQSFLSAISVADSGDVIYAPAGTYKITSTLTLNGNTSLVGDGWNSTILKFAPTANDTCIEVSDGASQVVRQTIRGIRIYSDDTTYTKVALDLIDVSSCIVDEVYIAGAGSGTPSAPYWSGANSIGLRTKGREVSSFSNLRICADYPIYIGQNPNETPTNNEDADHFQFSNCYLVANGHYCVTVADGLGVSNLEFSGYQAWVGGTGGFYMNDTRVAPTVPSRNIVFRNVRTEQIQDANGWAFSLSFTDVCQLLTIENVIMASTSKGINISSVTKLELFGVTAAMTSNSLTVAGATSSSSIDMQGCFWQPTSTVTLTNYVPTSISAWISSSNPAPATATYAFTNTSTYSNWFVLKKSAASNSLAADTNEGTLATITIPANVLGPNGAMRVTTYWETTNNANAKTARVRFSSASGTQFLTKDLASSATHAVQVMIFNQNSASSQFGTTADGYSGGSGLGASSGSVVTAAVDTSAETTVVITGQKASAGDTMTLRAYLVEVIAG